MASSSNSSLRDLLHERLIEAFGEPQHRTGGGAHWWLRARREGGGSVNLIATGTSQPLGLWVFDPADRATGMLCTTIHSVEDVEVVIKSICERVHSSYSDRKNSCAPRAHANDRTSK